MRTDPATRILGQTVLTALMLAAAGAAGVASTRPAEQGWTDVGVEEFGKRMGRKGHVVLDVRTAREYAAGHIPGAILIDVNSADFPEKIKRLDKKQAYLVYCATGRRSVRASKALADMGFKHIANLKEGFRAWDKAGKEVER